jgi:hypothetical protein
MRGVKENAQADIIQEAKKRGLEGGWGRATEAATGKHQ